MLVHIKLSRKTSALLLVLLAVSSFIVVQLYRRAPDEASKDGTVYDAIDRYEQFVLPLMTLNSSRDEGDPDINDADVSSGFRPCSKDPIFLLSHVYKRNVVRISRRKQKYNSARLNGTCSDDPLIPKFVHYLWFDQMAFTFANRLAILSAHKFIKPDYIFIHGDTGISRTDRWWNETAEEVPNIYWVDMEKPLQAPNGLNFRSVWHVSDYIRIKVLTDIGGIYMDNDVLLCRSIDEFLKHQVVYPKEQKGKISPALLMGHRGAPFLRMALELYHTYRGSVEEWDRLGLKEVHTLAQLFPHLVHIIRNSFNLQGPELIFDSTFNWSTNYFIHLWRDWYDIPRGPEDVLKLNSTFGEVARHILS